MTSRPEPTDERPSPQDVRETVDRMMLSDDFARSPQLAAFLRFVVEAVLQGKSDRIKGYTIGVEVLRRDPKFDPQADPIVRVEATRLRRTIERYYAGPGADDPIVIDLPRGSYVPTFRRRKIEAPSQIAPQVGVLGGWRRAAVVAGIAAVAVGIVVTAILLRGGGTSVTEHTASMVLPPGNGMPVMLVETLETTGTPPSNPPGPSPVVLSERIRDAFSRFDTINIVVEPKHSSNNDYRLIGSIDYRDDQASFRFRLLDSSDSNIVWSQTFDNDSAKGEKAVTDEIVTALATALLQSYGVIRSRDRARQISSSEGDPRYRCILLAADALRSQQPAEYEAARSCLERLTALDPSFAVGFSFLTVVYTREHQLGYTARPGDSPPLDRALRAARRAVELNPASSRAHVVLMVALFARGDVAEAFAAGDKALALNPYDMLTFAEYGGRLVLSDEVARGMTMLRRAAQFQPILPSWHHFYLFLGHYLAGDLHEASYQASQITAEDYAAGYLAKALAAAATGDAARAREAIDRLIALAPAWRDDPRQELRRFIPNPGIVDRLGRDLATAGLGGRS